MHRNSLVRGLLGIFGVWITSAALPMINSGVLKQFSPEQLLAARGVLSAVVVFAVLRGRIFGVGGNTYIMAVLVSGAALGLYKGIRIWGGAPTIMVITATPVLNHLFGLIIGRKTRSSEMLGMLAVVSGVVLALFEQELRFNWLGFFWSLFGTFMNAVFYEFISLSKAEPFQKTFWGCLAMGGLGLASSGTFDVPVSTSMFLAVLVFALVGGFLYWWSNMVAFDKRNLPLQTASILAQGETITVIILVSTLIIGERHLSMIQWAGVTLALSGAVYLARNAEPSQS